MIETVGIGIAIIICALICLYIIGTFISRIMYGEFQFNIEQNIFMGILVVITTAGVLFAIFLIAFIIGDIFKALL